MLKLTAIGHLGKDAIINNVNSKQVINFSLAHSEKYKDAQGQQVEKTTWVDCAYWSDSRVGDYLKKGMQVYVEGQPEVRTYPKNDGTQGASLSVRVGKIELLGGKNQQGEDQPSNNSQPEQPAQQKSEKINTPTPSDDLPF